MATDPYRNPALNDGTRFGTSSRPVTPSDSADLDPVPRAVEVVSIAGGTVLEYLPVDGDAGTADDWVTVSGVAVGYVTRCRPVRIGEATTCTVRTID